MGSLHTLPYLFTASGLLSQATGPGGIGFAKPPSQTDQPQQVRKITLYNARAVYGDATGEVQIFDCASAAPGPNDEIWGSSSPSAVGGVDSASDVCAIAKSGDLYVKINGAGVKVYVYISIED